MREALLQGIERYSHEVTSAFETARRFAAFVRDTPEPFARTTAAGHVTSSAFVLSNRGGRVLLVRHAKLGIWVQPGGHVDASDSSLLEAAKREVMEETGLAELEFPIGAAILDLDIHPIPARGIEGAHFHYDVRHLFVAPEDPPHGSEHAEWVALIEFAALSVDQSVIRPVRRALALMKEGSAFGVASDGAGG